MDSTIIAACIAAGAAMVGYGLVYLKKTPSTTNNSSTIAGDGNTINNNQKNIQISNNNQPINDIELSANEKNTLLNIRQVQKENNDNHLIPTRRLTDLDRGIINTLHQLGLIKKHSAGLWLEITEKGYLVLRKI